MKCKICNSEINDHKIYCSNECKFKDDEYNKMRVSKNKNPKNKLIRHIETKKTFRDVLNKSGVLGKYSKYKLGRDLNWNEWEIIDTPSDTRVKIKCPYCEWKTVDINNKAGSLGIHCQRVHHKLIADIITEYPNYITNFNALKYEEEIFLNLNNDNRIVCQICKRALRKLTNTHLSTHNISPDEYRQKYDIQNLSSKTTSSKLSKLYFMNESLLNAQYISNGESEIKLFLQELGIPTKVRRLSGVEFDLYNDEYKIAIEYNGLYWHAEQRGKDKYYHINKTEYAEKNGIHLIHIFEDEWIHKKDIIKSRLKHLFKLTNKKIYARKCVIHEISSKVKNKFLSENHIQGVDSSKIKLGAFYETELVGVMTFRYPIIAMGHRKNNSELIELSRFATKLNLNVIGIGNKFLSYFKKNYDFLKIISYADRRWTTVNNIYDKLGFKLESITSPNYWYTKHQMKRYYRYNFTKSKIMNKFENANKSLSEYQNMLNFGYDRIWDCGHLKYSFKLK